MGLAVEHLLPGAQRPSPSPGHRDGGDDAGQRRRIGGAGVAAPEPLERRALAFERGPAREIRPASSRAAHPEAGERVREDGDLRPLRVRPELVPVERQARLEAERVAGPEAGRRRAGRREPGPQPLDPVRTGEYLEADPLAGVAGPGHDEVGSLETDRRMAVAPRLRERAGRDDRRQHPFRPGPLEGDHGEGLALVVEAGAAFEALLDPLDGARPVGGVDHEQEVVRSEPVEVGVVDGPPPFVGEERVVGRAGRERRRVVGEDAAKGRLRPGPPDAEPAHVGYVEEARAAPGGEVLGDDPAPVLDRHLPARELHHPAAVRPVPAVQRGLPRGRPSGTGLPRRHEPVSESRLGVTGRPSMSTTGWFVCIRISASLHAIRRRGRSCPARPAAPARRGAARGGAGGRVRDSPRARDHQRERWREQRSIASSASSARRRPRRGRPAPRTW